MTPADVRRLFLDRLGLRLEPEMAAYVLRRMSDAGAAARVPVIGGDARTGRPVRTHVALAELAAAAATSGDTRIDAAPIRGA